jgi:hypothetical protein
VFCPLSRLDDSADSIPAARETTRIFADLHLLDVDTLASVSTGEPQHDRNNPQVALMRAILLRQGYTEEETITAIVTICQAAAGLRQYSTDTSSSIYGLMGKQCWPM